MKTNKQEKIVKGFKIYSLIMQEVWKLLTIIGIGILVGWLITKDKESKVGFVISIVVALAIGLAVFFVSLIRLSQKLNKDKEKEDEKPEE